MKRRASSDRPFEKPGAERDKVALSRWLRRRSTRAEAALWSALRRRQLGGWKFRRQHVIVGYVVDFYCAELRLIVEVDGRVHENQRPDDRAREADLRRIGAQIVRFSNDAVLNCLQDVLRTLARCAALRASALKPLLPPAPRGEGRDGGP